jgi:hypothetical protein
MLSAVERQATATALAVRFIAPMRSREVLDIVWQGDTRHSPGVHDLAAGFDPKARLSPTRRLGARIDYRPEPLLVKRVLSGGDGSAYIALHYLDNFDAKVHSFTPDIREDLQKPRHGGRGQGQVVSG